MGGPRITQEIWYLTHWVWQGLVDSGLEPSAKEVRAALKDKLIADGKQHLPLPGIRKMQDMLKEIKQNREALSETERNMDRPWSVATLAKYEIPPEAMPKMLCVSKLCKALQHPFTIRMARWVGRLHTLFEEPYDLLTVARSYTFSEMGSVYLKQPLESTELDLLWTDSPWEAQTAKWVGRYSIDEILEVEFPTFDIGVTGANLVAMMAEIRMEEGLSSEESSRFEDLYRKLHDFKTLNISNTGKVVYAYWLQHFTEGPSWPSLNASQRVSIIEKLREWIQEHLVNLAILSPENFVAEVRELIDTRTTDSQQIAVDAMKDDVLLTQMKYAAIDLLPEELLEQVGYDPSSYKRDPLNQGG